MDALWQNVNGEWKANHSCGHDAHMTMVFSALKCLIEIGYIPKGRLKIIFQPAEEGGGGSQKLLESGVIDDIDAMLGMHLRPSLEMNLFEASPGIYHGSSAKLRGKLIGVPAHASRPYMGINTADALAAIVFAVNSVKVNSTIPYSAKVTLLHTEGNELNIIPDKAEFGIDLRAQTNDVMNDLLRKVEQAVISAGSFNGTKVEVEKTSHYYAAIPNLQMEQLTKEAIQEMDGIEVVPAANVPGGDDFHLYSITKKKLAATMVGLGCDLKPGLHHPEMKFDIKALSIGAKIMAASVIKIFKNQDLIKK